VTAAVSIVVVSWNTRAALARCLASVVRDPLGAESEVWVVDNGSSDGSAAMVEERFPRIRLVRNDANRGFAAACNQALVRATGQVAVLLNSDAMVEPGCLERLRGVLDRRPEIGVVGGQLIGPEGRPQRSHGRVPTVGAFVGEMLGADRVPGLRRLVPSVASPPRRRERGREVGHVSGACLAIRRDVLERAGLLDERFFLYFEDTDLCVRARRAGFLVWFEPGALVRHEGQASAAQLGPEAEVQYARSASAFVRKHYGPAAARRLSAALRVSLAAHVAAHRMQALVGRPGAREALDRKRRLRNLHRSLGRQAGRRPGGPRAGVTAYGAEAVPDRSGADRWRETWVG
jgi:N-acetylglucosaminyl-diphospho-decaprenol L-rhamnosyltransferase